MANPLVRMFQRQSLRANVRRALECGVGLYHATWHIERETDAHGCDELVVELIDWSRDVLSRMQRPYGLDYVTLALAVLSDEGGQLASANYDVLRPQDFYDHGSAEAQIRETLGDWARTQVIARGGSVRLSAVLFSWGDLTRELLLTG